MLGAPRPPDYPGKALIMYLVTSGGGFLLGLKGFTFPLTISPGFTRFVSFRMGKVIRSSLKGLDGLTTYSEGYLEVST